MDEEVGKTADPDTIKDTIKDGKLAEEEQDRIDTPSSDFANESDQRNIGHCADANTFDPEDPGTALCGTDQVEYIETGNFLSGPS